jgi:DNA-binding winged helix-turn-helix (wHTH) protein
LIFVFGDCELDLDRFELRRGGQPRPVEPQVFDLLAVLIRERHRVVPKEELLDIVWGNRFVSESAVTSRVKAARQAIGDDGRSQRLIRTAMDAAIDSSHRRTKRRSPSQSPVSRRPRRSRRSDSA